MEGAPLICCWGNRQYMQDKHLAFLPRRVIRNYPQAIYSAKWALLAFEAMGIHDYIC